jgi:sphingoid base N-palmitoyltransferase
MWLFARYNSNFFFLNSKKKIKVWLPPNVTWKDIEPGSREDIVYADYRHLIWPIPISLVIIVIRYVVER